MDAARCPDCGKRTLAKVHNEFNPRVLWRCPCGWVVKGRKVDVPAPAVYAVPPMPERRERPTRGPIAPGLRPDELPNMPPKFHAIVGIVCDHMRVELAEFCGRGRMPAVYRARELVVQLCRDLTNLSYPEIARGMGRPNHSSLLDMHRRARERMVSDAVKAEVAGLVARVAAAIPTTDRKSQ